MPILEDHPTIASLPSSRLASATRPALEARLLCLGLVLGLAGCGTPTRADAHRAATEPATATSTTTATTAPAASAPSVAAAAPGPAPAPAAAPVAEVPDGPFAVPPYGTSSECPGDASDTPTPDGPLVALRDGTADPDLAASTALEGCANRSADVARALNAGGLVHHGRGEFEISAAWFAKAVRVAPNASGPRYNLMCALSRLGRLDDAFAQLTELRRAGDEGARRIERIARDADLEAMRSDPRFAAATTSPVETVPVAPNPFDLGEREDLRVGRTSRIPMTRLVPPTFDGRSAVLVSRIPWRVVRDELGYERRDELTFASDDEAPAPASDPGAPPAPPAPPTPLGAGYLPVVNVTWWSPAPGVVFLVVPRHVSYGYNAWAAPNPAYSSVDFYRVDAGELVPAGYVGFLAEWNEDNSFGFARDRRGTAFYFYLGDTAEYLDVTEIAYIDGRLQQRRER